MIVRATIIVQAGGLKFFRMKYLAKYVVFFFSNIILSHVNAQLPGETKGWTIQDCFQYAFEHNIQIGTLRLNEQFAEQELSLVNAAKIPNLSASVSNTFNRDNNSSDNNSHLVNQFSSAGTYLLNSSIVLWNDNYINNNLRQKQLLKESAGLLVKQSMNTITLLITQAYLDILLAKENLVYISDLVRTSGARVQQGELFYGAGSIARKDLLQLKAQLASDRYLLVQTENSVRRNILYLKQILQLPGETIFDIAMPASVEATGVMPSLHDVQQTALQNYPEIKAGELGVEIAALDVAKAKAGFKPLLTANGALGTGYNNIITNSIGLKTGYFTQAGNNFYQRLGVTLSVPIFSNRINKTNLEKAKISNKQAGLNLQNDRLVLSQAVEQAYLNAANAQQAYNAANEQFTATVESYRIVNEQFKLGGVNTFDLLQQRNQYVQVLQVFTQAKYAAVLQQKIYTFYIGEAITLNY